MDGLADEDRLSFCLVSGLTNCCSRPHLGQTYMSIENRFFSKFRNPSHQQSCSNVASPNLERDSIVRVRVYVAGRTLHWLLFYLGFFRFFYVLVEMVV